MPKTFEILLSGQVQGVGFRPFVFNLAVQYGLKGQVFNNANGVVIRLNSSAKKAQEFFHDVLEKAPEISRIIDSTLGECEFQDFDDFQIVRSKQLNKINIPLTPDFAICESCQKEIRDPDNRRYGYAFTTCTNCGPRYAITSKFPFEREHTSLALFEMCGECQSEYEDPTNRRFHSQTNSCSACGIQMRLTDFKDELISDDQHTIIQRAAECLAAEKILAIKNTNGFLLCCLADSDAAVKSLRERKKRPSKPFAVLYPSLEMIKKTYEVNSSEENVLASAISPIVLLNPKGKNTSLSSEVAPGLSRVGCMLPNSALLTLLMDELKVPLIATSGNIHGSPIIDSAEEAIQNLSGVADYFLHHNLPINFPQDDSVMRFVNDLPIVLRRSRGMAPNYFTPTPKAEETILAMGAHLKSSITFVPNEHTYTSPYFGNLENFDVLKRYQRSITDYENLFQTKAETVLIDAHPQYQSSQIGKEIAQENGANLELIQHHKAHFGAVLGEHELLNSEESILGVIWDGTGLGDDGAIWGGEFFTYANRKMERIAHFEYVPWIAANKMAREPRLALLAHLPQEFSEVIAKKFQKNELALYQKLAKKKSLMTSSVGRLFDAVSSLLDLCDVSTYEGEAAMMLEALAEDNDKLPIDLLPEYTGGTVPTKSLMMSLYNEMKLGTSKSLLADSFIYTLACIIVKMSQATHHKIVGCSGGVFQNGRLVKHLIQLTDEKEIDLKLNRLVSCNDENISFGQLCCYRYLKK